MPVLKKTVFEAPPTVKLGRKKVTPTERLVRSARRNPGQWIVHSRRNHASAAAPLKKKFPGLEVTTRSVGSGRVDVYIRWPERVAA